MARTISFFILLCGCIPIVKAQDDSKILVSKKAVIGIQFTPKYSFRELKSQTENGKVVIALRNNNELAILSKSFGVSMDYFFTKKIALGMSVLYSENGERIQPFSIQPLTQNGFEEATTEYWFVYKANYIEVPIKFNYVFLDGKKISIFTTIGIVNNIFLNQKQFLFARDLSTNKISKTKNSYASEMNAYAISFMLAAGIDFNINKFKIRVQPSYDRFVSSATQGNIKTYYYNTSLTLGVFYKF